MGYRVGCNSIAGKNLAATPGRVDMASYANAVGIHLGHAVLVVDHFHVMQLANRAIDDLRRRVQHDTLGHRGRTGDPLYGIRKLLLKASGDLNARGWTRLAAGLAAGDPAGSVAAAWQLKELVRDLYRSPDIDAARRVLNTVYAWADTGDVPRCAAWPARCAVGRTRCWPTSPPAARPMGLLKPST